MGVHGRKGLSRIASKPTLTCGNMEASDVLATHQLPRHGHHQVVVLSSESPVERVAPPLHPPPQAARDCLPDNLVGPSKMSSAAPISTESSAHQPFTICFAQESSVMLAHRIVNSRRRVFSREANRIIPFGSTFYFLSSADSCLAFPCAQIFFATNWARRRETKSVQSSSTATSLAKVSCPRTANPTTIIDSICRASVVC